MTHLARIPDNLYQLLQARAKKHDRSVAAELRVILESILRGEN